MGRKVKARLEEYDRMSEIIREMGNRRGRENIHRGKRIGAD